MKFKGKVTIKYVESCKWFNIGLPKMYRMARTFVTSGITKEIEKSNAELIADAFNTINECDMMPSELLARYKEAVSALEEYYNADRCVFSKVTTTPQQRKEQAQQVITKSKEQ